MKKRIVLVEDESIARMDISLTLQDAGYEVVGQAGNGEKAIEVVHECQPDLIIMDIKMPKLNGLKASKIISQKFNIPILLLTAYSQQDFIDKAKESNIVGYIVKPVSGDRLIPSIEIALHQSEVSNQYRKEIKEAKDHLNERKVIEKAKGILMERFNYSEENAFKKIRTISMNKQVTLGRVAKHIIKKYSSGDLKTKSE
ncbi:ANTAR domain-containing response regulator [Virgibacillus necropolis]|uniref:Response regulator n=1 Tax=Virgibacillus necropolis TaxID=163877 RepID=A0A221M9K5_9BACI|nr:response regulator [Virgibacillus necropolis]ASN04336.1 response regulator [Virgibacillus necropolis]